MDSFGMRSGYLLLNKRTIALQEQMIFQHDFFLCNIKSSHAILFFAIELHFEC